MQEYKSSLKLCSCCHLETAHTRKGNKCTELAPGELSKTSTLKQCGCSGYKTAYDAEKGGWL